ncbi:twin transmembrane helix small protein [Roseovarius aestuarii]|nr:twin transmembrane helix small protein [Roseovarius aestuarii]
MFNDPLFLLVLFACGAVGVILIMGIASFGKGGQDSAKRSNKFMQWRIIAQFIAVLVILAFVTIRSQTGAP